MTSAPGQNIWRQTNLFVSGHDEKIVRNVELAVAATYGQLAAAGLTKLQRDQDRVDKKLGELEVKLLSVLYFWRFPNSDF